jgi:hypothetical protein
VARPAALLTRLLIFVHRWLGVGLSVIFMLWFVSGIVMMYWTYPSVTARDRLERSPRLAPASVRLSAEEAAATLGVDVRPSDLRLASFDGRPAYGVSSGRGGGAGLPIVYADDGTLQIEADDRLLDRAAAAWSGRPVDEARKQLVEEVDQWTVGGVFRFSPLYKYSWPDGQQVYVSGDTGEVVQYTTTASRFWAWVGAIPHWMYFTPLRKRPEWFSFVVWSSLIGTVAALLGLVIAICMYSPRKQYRHAGAPTSIPYRGWKRLHTIFGLVFGAVTVTWTFSGLLSMGPFPIMDRLTQLTVPAEGASAEPAGGPGRRGGPRGPNLAGALRGGRGLTFAAYAPKPPADAIASVPDFDVREIEHASFDGAPMYIASNGRGDTRIVPVTGDPMTSLDPEDVMRVVRRAAGSSIAELRLMHEYDAYYLDRRGERPLPVVYVRLNDAVGTRYYVDPRTGRVVGNHSARNWVNRWLYHGLHSLDFPWLYKYRPLWDIVVITLLLGGAALCTTSILLTWRVLARRAAAVLRARPLVGSEDLA